MSRRDGKSLGPGCVERGAWDVAVIGAGSAGLAAAVAAATRGARVIMLDREQYAGGVLPQCVHDGFGLHLYGTSLTGPEYAEHWRALAADAGVHFALGTTLLSLAQGEDGLFRLEALGNAIGGHRELRARSVICATGCRERTRGQMRIPGTRPAGVLTAGTAQYMVNVRNQLPGDKVVILGSGDIGLIMARRLVLEGADVRLVLGQEATGLLRNHVRCIRDFDIPIRYGWGLMRIHGRGQLKGVSVAPLAEDGSFDLSRREYVRCNVLLIACGLIPERDVFPAEMLEGDGIDGLYVCGNAKVPHDLVDQVTQDGLRAGSEAAAFALGADVGRLPADLQRLMELPVVEARGRLGDLAGIDAVLAAGATACVCTECPTGCVVRAWDDGCVEGNGCERGRAFALREMREPHRTFTGTVKVRGAAFPLLPVRTAGEVPRDALGLVARACRRMRAYAPVCAGDVVCPDVAGTGVALIATESRERVTPDDAGEMRA